MLSIHSPSLIHIPNEKYLISSPCSIRNEYVYIYVSHITFIYTFISHLSYTFIYPYSKIADYFHGYTIYIYTHTYICHVPNFHLHLRFPTPWRDSHRSLPGCRSDRRAPAARDLPADRAPLAEREEIRKKHLVDQWMMWISDMDDMDYIYIYICG